MELLGLLLVLTAIAEKIGKAIGWCLVTLVKGFAILIVAIARLIVAEINRRENASIEEKSISAESSINPNIDDAVAGLKKLGLPEAAARRLVTNVAAAAPEMSTAQLIKATLKSLDKAS
jgi:Holliday junction resolvasome RuvABC DNA-binding subunit